jgi:asparagine synthase (glutamine-hydrolysing)
MCGICGISHADNRVPEQGLIEKMTGAILHRGPDSDGFYVNAGIGLGVRRLAIIDVAGGDQPIPNEDESLWVIFNGESHNFPELHADLVRRGHEFRTQSDTECILHLYEEYGDECVQYLRGQAAIALWDGRERKLLLARDRMGKKPLYYSTQNGTICFASELSALLKALPHEPEVHLEALDLYLSLQYIPDPFTAYKNIYKLPPAHRLIWQDGTARLEKYWDFAYQPKHTADEDELIEELRTLLKEAVRIRLLSEVALGAHLSGGIDSSIIVALMAEISDAPVKTFSVGFEEEAFSELEHARTIAQKYSTDHHEFILKYGDLPSTLETITRHFGEPFADPSAIPLYHISKMTREHVTVVINGDGGDEDFAGYQRYWLDPVANQYLRAPQFLTRKLIPSVVRHLPDSSNRPVGQSLVNGLKRLHQLPEIDARASILRWGSFFSPRQRARLWKPEFKFRPDNAQSLLAERFDSMEGSFLDKTLYTDLHTYLPGDLLVKTDRMGMAASIEPRSPFLDHKVVEWAARLPDHFKVRGLSGKYLLRKAFAEELPDSIKRRGKQGFGIPLGAWFRGPLYDWAKELLTSKGNPLEPIFNSGMIESLLEEHRTGRMDHGKRIYALTMLALWSKGKNDR